MRHRAERYFAESPHGSLLVVQSRWAIMVSWDSAEDFAGRQRAKYLPVMPVTPVISVISVSRRGRGWCGFPWPAMRQTPCWRGRRSRRTGLFSAEVSLQGSAGTQRVGGDAGVRPGTPERVMRRKLG